MNHIFQNSCSMIVVSYIHSDLESGLALTNRYHKYDTSRGLMSTWYFGANYFAKTPLRTQQHTFLKLIYPYKLYWQYFVHDVSKTVLRVRAETCAISVTEYPARKRGYMRDPREWDNNWRKRPCREDLRCPDWGAFPKSQINEAVWLQWHHVGRRATQSMQRITTVF